MKIYKFPLQLADQQTIDVPTGTRVLDVQMQNGAITVWALVPQGPVRPHRIYLFGTGFDVPSSSLTTLTHIGTVQTPSGFVWHLFTDWKYA
jgi:hypothetical protein